MNTNRTPFFPNPKIIPICVIYIAPELTKTTTRTLGNNFKLYLNLTSPTHEGWWKVILKRISHRKPDFMHNKMMEYLLLSWQQHQGIAHIGFYLFIWLRCGVYEYLYLILFIMWPPPPHMIRDMWNSYGYNKYP